MKRILRRLLAVTTALGRGRTLVIGLPYLWLIAFVLLPSLLVLQISFSEMDSVRFKDLLSFKEGVLALALKVSNYTLVVQDDLYFKTYVSSLKYAALTTLLCLALGYPFAYFMARARATAQPALLMLVMLPFWTSFLLRVYAWKGLLSDNGWLAQALSALHADQLLLAAGLIPALGKYMNSPFALTVGMVYTYLPFMILPLYATLIKLDRRLLEAAADLGATPWGAFWRITVPLSKAGIIAGAMLVFIPSIGQYIIPELLGGPETLMIGRVLWDEFFGNGDWPMAASVAMVMMALIVVPLAIFNRYQAQAREAQ